MRPHLLEEGFQLRAHDGLTMMSVELKTIERVEESFAVYSVPAEMGTCLRDADPKRRVSTDALAESYESFASGEKQEQSAQIEKLVM